MERDNPSPHDISSAPGLQPATPEPGAGLVEPFERDYPLEGFKPNFKKWPETGGPEIRGAQKHSSRRAWPFWEREDWEDHQEFLRDQGYDDETVKRFINTGKANAEDFRKYAERLRRENPDWDEKKIEAQIQVVMADRWASID